MIFHIKYFKGTKWVMRCQKNGKPVEWIEKYKYFNTRDQKVWKVPNGSNESCTVLQPTTLTCIFLKTNVEGCTQYIATLKNVTEYFCSAQ